eukprot:7856263-Lingulodinium_polyedra.AAC.1
MAPVLAVASAAVEEMGGGEPLQQPVDTGLMRATTNEAEVTFNEVEVTFNEVEATLISVSVVLLPAMIKLKEKRAGHRAGVLAWVQQATRVNEAELAGICRFALELKTSCLVHHVPAAKTVTFHELALTFNEVEVTFTEVEVTSTEAEAEVTFNEVEVTSPVTSRLKCREQFPRQVELMSSWGQGMLVRIYKVEKGEKDKMAWIRRWSSVLTLWWGQSDLDEACQACVGGWGIHIQ